jgi:hypothetical protein
MLSEMTLCDGVFHTASGTAFADIVTDGHRETWPIRSKRFRSWLRRRYYEATGDAPSAAAIRSALDLLEARAQFDAPERAVHIRVAEHAGHIYLDLADDHWRAVVVGPEGWRVIGCPAVRFRRPAGMLQLPVPERGGSIETLRSFLNLSSRNDFVLVVAWLLAALRPAGPYPVLAISGEQGSAKTVLSKLLRALIDPNAAPVRSLSRKERELMIAANNGYLLAFDNLSGLPVWLSDSLCRLASGGSFAVRQLYTNDEEVLFQAARPILLNGIEDIVSRADLGDRAIFLTLAPIGEAQRRAESELWRQFESARPQYCGGVEAGLLMSQHRRHSTALSPVNVISSIEGDDHQTRGRSRKEANCDRIRCVLGSGPSIFSNSSDARLRPPDENLAQPNLVLIWFCRCWAAPFPTGNRTAQHLALGKTSPPVLPRRYDDKLLRARRFDPATCAVVP